MLLLVYALLFFLYNWRCNPEVHLRQPLWHFTGAVQIGQPRCTRKWPGLAEVHQGDATQAEQQTELRWSSSASLCSAASACRRHVEAWLEWHS